MAQVREVDCRGLSCPQPVISTKRALEGMESGRIIAIVDNDVARENVTLFARNAGCEVRVETRDGHHYIDITKGDAAPAQPESGSTGRDTDSVVDPQGAVYLFSTNMLGQGSPELGLVLMKSLFATIAENKPLPGALLFLNTGVHLTCQDSPVLSQIKSMAGQGTQVISCGTCLEYYKIKDRLEVGIIGNMFAINDIMLGPGKLITIA